MKSMSRNNRMPLPARSAGRRALLACFLAALLGKTIHNIHTGSSVSVLFV